MDIVKRSAILLVVALLAIVLGAGHVQPTHAGQFPLEAFVPVMVSEETGQVGYGSGSVVQVPQVKNMNVVVTAGHVCAEATGVMVADRGGNMHEAFVIWIDELNDICVLITDRFESERVRLAPRGPQVGDRIVVMAAPLGIWSSGITAVFDGRYAGPWTSHRGSAGMLMTAPAAAGSSGGAVLDERGRMVGILNSVTVEFEHLTFAATYEHVRDAVAGAVAIIIASQ